PDLARITFRAHQPPASAKRKPAKPAVKTVELSEEEHDLFVEEFPDPVEEGVAHAVVAATDLGVNLGAADQESGGLFRQAGLFGDVVPLEADVSEDDRFGLVVIVLVGVGDAGDVQAFQLALEDASGIAPDQQIDVEFLVGVLLKSPE